MTKSIFGIHDPVGLRYLFQLRVCLSPLRSHKCRHNFTDATSDICHCSPGIEDTNHFLFSRPDNAILRATLAASVINVITKKKPELFRKSIEIVFIWTSIHNIL